jgi:hypothetical protein
MPLLVVLICPAPGISKNIFKKYNAVFFIKPNFIDCVSGLIIRVSED